MLDMYKCKIAMLNKNITATEIAEKLNCNVNTISRWNKGKNLEQIELFIDYLILLDIDFLELKKEC